MNCPTCKYANPPGATHCGMCYEVFNRSAADSYMRSVRRERLQAQRQPPSATSSLQPVAREINDTIKNIDWAGLFRGLWGFVHHYRKSMGIVFAVAGVAILADFLSSPAVRFSAYGSRLTYSFKNQKKTKYLVGLQTNVKIWSERQGQLDTPIDQFQVDNIGNVFLQKKDNSKDHALITMTPQEWIEIIRRGERTESRNIPLDHPTLAPMSVQIDGHGTLVQRYYRFSPRLAKSLDFLMPSFPRGTVRKGWAWTEPVQWVEMIGDWKIFWGGDLRWTVVGQANCGDTTCDQLEYQADLQPRLSSVPAWASGAVRIVNYHGTASGLALFDAHHGRLFSNSFRYDGMLRIPISDLSRIPRTLRVGRRVRGPGELVFDYKSRIEIHQP